MSVIDLGPAARSMEGLLHGAHDGQLPGATPCPSYALGDLIDHIGGLSLAFTAAASKAGGEMGAQGPSGDATRLGHDWRNRIPQDLSTLAEAWRDPAAWTGMTKAGGVDLPGEVAGLVALNELVIHGWDVARASGQPYDIDAPTLQACHGFVMQFSAPGQEAQREGLFGPVVPVPDDAPLLDRVIGLSGRDPRWSPE